MVVAHAFNPSTQEAEAGGSLSSRPAWSTEQVPGQSGLLHRENLSEIHKCVCVCMCVCVCVYTHIYMYVCV